MLHFWSSQGSQSVHGDDQHIQSLYQILLELNTIFSSVMIMAGLIEQSHYTG